MRRAYDLTVFAILTLLGGCSLVYSDDLAQKQCTVQQDCEASAQQLGTPLVCRSNACQAPFCARSADCPRGSTCSQNLCIAPRTDGGAPAPTPCGNDADCLSGSRCGFDGTCYAKWGCLEQAPDWPTTASAPFDFRMETRRFTFEPDPSMAPEISVRACPSISPSCAPPVLLPAQRIASNILTARFSAPFTGSIQLDPSGAAFDGGLPASDAGTSLLPLPALIHFTAVNPLASEQYAQSRLVLTSTGVFEAVAASLRQGGVDITFDASKSVVAMQVHDCGGRPAPGVAMAPRNASNYTFVPVQGEIEAVVGGTRTGSDGTAILINLDSGYQYLTIRDEDTQQLITDTLVFTVQAGAVNYVLYYPRNSALQKWVTESRRRGLLTEAVQ